MSAGAGPAAADPGDAGDGPDRIEGAPHPRDTLRLIGQGAAESAFLAAFNAGRLHSGWLLAGPQGVGKATLAYRIAAFLLADPGGAEAQPASLDLPADDAGLRLIRAGAHPRLFVLRRGAAERGTGWKSQITVDESRRLRGFFQLSATDGGRRVVIVDAADEMNPSAANAILKLLEEPPPLCTLLLVAHRPAALLPTIRSRCRVLRMGALAPDDLTRALAPILGEGRAPAEAALAELAGGSVGRAVTLAAAGGDALYREIVALLATLPRLDRAGAARLAETGATRGAGERSDRILELTDAFLARLARAGIMGPPATEAAPGEAALLARLAPHDRAARAWATLAADLAARARHGRAVNLDPAGLILDMLIRIEQTAKILAAA
ncbi:MAG: DNA polymerase III subunit delta' [Rubellimicrobium sp.]|nr:DNA polymerase III subunit delta' [Rubellimicrobium sp.]